MLSNLWFNLILLMFFPPVGVISMWLFTDVDILIKTIISVIVLFIMLIKPKSNDIFTVLMLIFFPPMGLISMWVLTKWSKILKIILTIMMSTYFYVILEVIINFIKNSGI